MKKLRLLDTRERAIISVLILGFIMFFALSPISNLFYETIFPPSALTNIEVEQKSREIVMKWDRAQESDIQGYYISLNGSPIIDEKLNNKDVDNFGIYDLKEGESYLVQIGSRDRSGNISNLAQITVKTENGSNNYLLNPSDETTENTRLIAMLAMISVVSSFLLTLWVLFFKVKGKHYLTVAAYPGISLAPLIILSSSLILTINSNVNKAIVAFFVSLGIVFVSYILILTANILNGSKVHGSIPLEQAAKASQFIVGLISTYLILIYAFSSNYNLIFKLALVLVFVFYFTYSSLSSIKELVESNILLRTVSVVLVMFVAMLAISVWPVESIYSILVIAIIYYIIFNVALEIRSKVGRSLWTEYGILIGLVTLLLLTNSVWGINGTII